MAALQRYRLQYALALYIWGHAGMLAALKKYVADLHSEDLIDRLPYTLEHTLCMMPFIHKTTVSNIAL